MAGHLALKAILAGLAAGKASSRGGSRHEGVRQAGWLFCMWAHHGALGVVGFRRQVFPDLENVGDLARILRQAGSGDMAKRIRQQSQRRHTLAQPVPGFACDLGQCLGRFAGNSGHGEMPSPMDISAEYDETFSEAPFCSSLPVVARSCHGDHLHRHMMHEVSGQLQSSSASSPPQDGREYAPGFLAFSGESLGSHILCISCSLGTMLSAFTWAIRLVAVMVRRLFFLKFRPVSDDGGGSSAGQRAHASADVSADDDHHDCVRAIGSVHVVNHVSVPIAFKVFEAECLVFSGSC